MTRRLFIAGVIALYLGAVVLWNRWKRARELRHGIAPRRMRPFDQVALLDELSELYEAGLVPAARQAQVPGRAPERANDAGEEGDLKNEVAGSALSERLPWFWPERISQASEALEGVAAHAQTLLDRGKIASVIGLVEPGQAARLDQRFATLGLHAFLKAYDRGDLEQADEILAELPAWTNGRISERLVAVYQAGLERLRCDLVDTEHERQVHARRAYHYLRQSDPAGGYAEPGMLGLWANLRLGFLKGPLSSPWIEFSVGRGLRRGLSAHPHSAVLYYELGHLCVLQGKSAEAIDHLARAAYFSGTRRFYREALLCDPVIATLKPGLVKKAREAALEQEMQPVSTFKKAAH